MHKGFRALVVDTEEVVLVQAFGHTGSMDDIVEVVAPQLLKESLLRREVQVDKMYPFILEILARTRSAHTRPRFKTAAQSFLHDEAANEATGTCY